MASNNLTDEQRDKYQERLYSLKGLALDIFQCLDYHDDENHFLAANLGHAEKIAMLQHRITELEERLSLTK